MTKLWTKNFTIITMGTVVSMLGNAVAGFAIGLMVLDYTESTLLYAIFMICYSLPRSYCLYWQVLTWTGFPVRRRYICWTSFQRHYMQL